MCKTCALRPPKKPQETKKELWASVRIKCQCIVHAIINHIYIYIYLLILVLLHLCAATVLLDYGVMVQVCNRVLHGGAKYGLPPVPKELRKQRCAGLRLLGKIFQREGATAVKIAKGKEGEDESAKKANFEDYQERVQKAAENIARKRNEDQAKEEESRP